MNRVINNPDMVVEDMLQGWLLAHAETITATNNPRVIKRIGSPAQGKVGIITGGGSGHEPAFLGYVGDGMVDAVAIGEIFSSPTAKSFLDAMRHANSGHGVACLYGNYAGDNMNVRLAVEMAERENITVRCVVANDDVASAPKNEEKKRRGVAGEILMWKVGAAKADMGATLEQVIDAAQKAIAATRSIGVGLSACIIPAVGKANFTIEPGFMEVGIGHHGEPGINVQPTVSAAEMAEMMLSTILPDLPFKRGDRVAVLVSGLGATPVMEQYILYAEVVKILSRHGIDVVFNKIGNLFTSLEMMGVTLTLMKLDDELLACLKHPCHSVGLSISGSGFAQTFHRAIKAENVKIHAAAAKQSMRPLREMNGESIEVNAGREIVTEMIEVINANRQYLSEIDGLIGDGDHGINMAKGFNNCASRLSQMGPEADNIPAALNQLSLALMDDIGGSMGPLYGKFFAGWVTTLQPYARMDAELFGQSLEQGINNVQSMGQAQPGDKTLIDTLVPALSAYRSALRNNSDFKQALHAMVLAAQSGKDSTKNMQARIGRSARLGPRSIGVLDAGATSCYLILKSFAETIERRLNSNSDSQTNK